MMRLFVCAALPLACSLGASAALAEERCLAAQYQPPAAILADMRPYLICGMIQGDGHVGTRLNGQYVTITGGGLDACGPARESAVEASVRSLASTMPDLAARRRLVAAEFEKADQFMRVAARSEDLTVGGEPSAPLCRNENAED